MNHRRVVDTKFVLSVICTGILSFSGVVVETALNVAFPALMREFAIGTGTVQWVTTGYLLVLALVLPISSYLKRRFSAKSLFVTATALFIAGTLAAATTRVFAGVLIGRILQGVGTGVALPLMFNIVLEQAPLHRMGLMMGLASSITALAPALGPSLGGLVIEYFGWRMIFVVLLPLLVAALILGAMSIRQVSGTEAIRLDAGGLSLLAIGFTCLIISLTNATRFGWASVPVLSGVIVACAAIALFAVHSLHHGSALIHVTVFASRTFTFSLLAVILTQFCVLALGYLLPNVGQEVLKANAFASGCLLLLGCGLGVMFAPLSGWLLDRFGAARPILLGGVCIAVSLLAMAMMYESASLLSYAMWYSLFAIGQGLSVPTGVTNAYRHVDKSLQPDANAVMNTLQQLAGACGTAVVTTIVSEFQASNRTSLAQSTNAGAGHSLLLLVLLAIASILCSILAIRFGRSYGVTRTAAR